MKNLAIISTSLNGGDMEQIAGFLSRRLSQIYNVYLFLLNAESVIYDNNEILVDIGSSGPFYEYLIKINKEKYSIDVAISFGSMMNFANLKTCRGEKVIIYERDMQMLSDFEFCSKSLQISRYYGRADEIVASTEAVKCGLQQISGLDTSVTIIDDWPNNKNKKCSDDKILSKWIDVINRVEKEVISDATIIDETSRLSRAKYILIYGTGLVGKSSFLRLSRKYKISGFIVSKIIDEKKILFDTEIYEIDNLTFPKDETAIVIGVGYDYQDEIVKKIKENGYEDIVYPFVEPFTYDYYSRNPKINFKLELVDWSRLRLERNFDIDNPKGFNEKIQWIKLYDNTEIKTKLADKYLVRDYVAEKIGTEYLVPLLGVWESVNEINFDELPDKFVLKCNHASETNLFIEDKNKIDFLKLRENFRKWLTINYAYFGFEMQYAEIKPRIIAEQMLIPDDGEDLKDYKVFVFNGKAKIIQVDIDRHHIHRRNLYDLEWKYLPYSIQYPTAPDIVIEKPECLEKLIAFAETLGSGFRHVRVDFYICNQQIYFGEMTFTHGNGAEKFEPSFFEQEMGDWIDIAF